MNMCMNTLLYKRAAVLEQSRHVGVGLRGVRDGNVTTRIRRKGYAGLR